ncbi:lanthionine synthetase LanC family protein [Aliicoccus persicus]|uniref:Serine/threonine protein kinase n=1 Tax=Aliicoccus persicus TaxID=930138 RepID=A0A662Z4V5_9STAP|nr:lanthionine synthetase LanC family protein [Aliicoccus persicus]SEW14045.1 Serine/threonine protein kinase [Aliicoccus persicus]
MKEFEYNFKKTKNISMNEEPLDNNLIFSDFQNISDNFPFRYVRIGNNYKDLPMFGWKIHLSPTLNYYDHVLEIVNNLSKEEGFDYKYVPNFNSYTFLSNKNTTSSQFGKYITIYPYNENQCDTLMSILYQLLNNIEGVQVPSDRPYKDSSFIHYRYGAISPYTYIDSFNSKDYYILDGYGNLVKDKRKSYFTLPLGIDDPFQSDKTLITNRLDELVIKNSKNDTSYTLEEIIRHSPTGNVYIGRDDNDRAIIIKEARKGAIPSLTLPKTRAKIARTNEFKFFKDNSETFKNIKLPQAYDIFEIEDSLFTVYEYLDGESLSSFLKTNPLKNPASSIEEKTQYKKSVLNIIESIGKFLIELHSKGLVFNDISDDNFMIVNNTLYVTDGEGVALTDDVEWSTFGTERFMYRKPKDLDGIQKDYYAFNQLIFYMIFNRTEGFYYDVEFYEKLYLAEKFSLPQLFINILKENFIFHEEVLSNNQSSLKYFLNNISRQNFSKVYENLKINQDNNLDKIDYIKTRMSEYYTNLLKCKDLEKLKISDYNDNVSLVYGLPGVYLVLKKLNLVPNLEDLVSPDEIIRLIRTSSNHSNNLGIVFGRMGHALFVQESGFSLGDNRELLDVVLKLQEINNPNYDFASGISGIYVGVQLMKLNTTSNHIFRFLERTLKSINWKISEFEGLSYGNIGVALSSSFMSNPDYDNIVTNVKADLNTVDSDYKFSGLSYSYLKWPKIRSPYLFSGSAGLLLSLVHIYHKFPEKYDSKMIQSILDSLDSESSYSTGIAFGMSGVCISLLALTTLPQNSENLKIHLKQMLNQKIHFIVSQFIENDKITGFLGDKLEGPKDDFGNGTLGVLYTLELYRLFIEDRLIWDPKNFIGLPIFDLGCDAFDQ